jgi:hypothetical protein
MTSSSAKDRGRLSAAFVRHEREFSDFNITLFRAKPPISLRLDRTDQETSS